MICPQKIRSKVKMATGRQSWLNNDTGILRKKEEDEELLVFGYSCKLFRDDEKALFIDQGKHLIPWMGDESLKIDRYDGRGALYDLKQYEALPGGHDANKWVGLSDAERRVEQLCDEERYRALHHNEEEEALYQEEELKRLHKALNCKSYGEVAFNYEEDSYSKKMEEKGDGEQVEEEVEGGDEPFTAPPELDIPINMVLDFKGKVFTGLRRKTRTKRNIFCIIFNTTAFTGPYRKNLLQENAVGILRRATSSLRATLTDGIRGEFWLMNDATRIKHQHFLCPESVKLNAIIEKTALFISQQGAQMEILLKMKQANNPQFQFLSFDSLLHPYYRHLLMAIKTGRYRPKSQQQEKDGDQEDGGDDHYLHPSLAPGGSRVESAPSIPSISYKPSADCAYSMLVNKIKNRQASCSTNPLQQPPAPGTADHVIPVQYQIAMEAAPMTTDHIIQASPVLYRNDPTAANPSAYRHIQQPVYAHVQVPAITIPKVSHNGDSSDDETYRIHGGSISSEGSRPTSPTAHEIFVLPPRDVQLIIDKMASYVAKNGRDFEAIVRSKGDSRFSFLDANHAYFSYYQHKVELYEKLEAPAMSSVPANNISGRMDLDDSSQDISVTAGAGEDSHDGSERSSDGSKNETSKPRPKPAPVCFSIKKPKESEAMLLEKRSALPIEESTDEEEGQEGEEKEKKEKEKKTEEKKKVEETIIKDDGKTKDRTETAETVNSHPSASNAGTSDENTSVKEVKEKKGTVDKDKWAEERVKDKLAAAAREKIAAAAREKQLQLERKRRAAAFINMIRKDHPLGTELTVVGPLLPDGAPVQRLTDDEGEVSSVPSPTSFSDVTSPQHVGNGNQDVEDRLNPKENGEVMPQTTSLFARIQASKQNVKRRHSDSDSGSNHSRSRSRSHSHSQSQSRGTDKHRHKRKKSSCSHKKSQLSSPPHHSHIRFLRHKKEDEHLKSRKSKKKIRSRSRSRSKSHHTRSHHHSTSEKSSSRIRHGSIDAHSNKKTHHKKNKKSSRSSERRSNSHTSNSS